MGVLITPLKNKANVKIVTNEKRNEVKMYKHTMYIGLSDKDTLKQEISTNEAEKIIFNTIGDCTIRGGNKGFYTMHNNMPVIENSLIVEKFGGSKRMIVEAAKILKKKLNQETIYVNTERSNSIMI